MKRQVDSSSSCRCDRCGKGSSERWLSVSEIWKIVPPIAALVDLKLHSWNCV